MFTTKMEFVDNFLNNITMYRLVLYGLVFLLLVAGILGSLGLMPYSFSSIILSVLIILVISIAANNVFARVFEAPANVESVYITALILALIITPIKSQADLPFLGWTAILAMSSKYILAIKNKHIFNPAAIAVALTSFAINKSASWWVGTLPMLPFVLVISFLIIRKIKKFDLVFGFFAVALIAVLISGIIHGQNLISTLKTFLINTPLFFFAGVMLTEPLTTPPTKFLQATYGALVGFLFVPQIHLDSIYFTPELALLVGNIYSYMVSPKSKLILKLKEKVKIAADIYDFVFIPDQKINYLPGQYMEWTENVNSPDSRGNRRYFTLASSPTENNLRIGVKFPKNPSSFKKTMLDLTVDSKIIASQLSGDFTLPSDSKLKFVFIAGGIGVTPFRSMIKYLLDSNQKRDIVLFYANKSAGDFVYQNIFDQAQKLLGVKTIYSVTDPDCVPKNWTGKTGRIDEFMIKSEVPDFKERYFYLSGPRSMITAFEETLQKMGIPKSQIKTDYFPGFV